MGTETLQRTFFAAYLPRFSKNNKGIIIDATSLPNQIHIPLTAWGRSGEEIDKQIRFLLVVDKSSEEPLFFRHYAGNIVDVSTLKTTIDELNVYGIKETYIYLDAGYFSEDNINDLYTSRMNFLTRLPSIRVLYKELIKKYVDSLEKYENMVRYGKRGLFIKQTNIELFGDKCC
ncbi:transposase [Candidatus Woesearchaeota archaeon]|nr:transposase [Candidatus Woesearchaeota archaeon]